MQARVGPQKKTPPGSARRGHHQNLAGLFRREQRRLVAGQARFVGSFDLEVDLVQTSCGSGVPIMRFEMGRGEEELEPFYAEMGEAGVEDYWRRKNVETIDGKATGIFDT